ncbi:hypothetical protein C0R09_01315 [Brevibacillus laterosporus]|uniref:UvrD-helicase domain-containing protein n=1 Tax=Brevibacillus laterosporus TaxID=1465 RepID=UPI000C75E2F4|nr:ATP-dependent helicase [Brevibacillus laterosporus]AUM63298.1 hypothetical protein C0R09_01315 [Brevibacillus laterosporus]
MFSPTSQQIDILEYNGNLVVAAGAGSGKTTTIASKIANIVEGLKWYQGVIAISYTNKASQELKRKTLRFSSDVKNSFFGTIDSFLISNSIMRFAKHYFGLPTQKVVIQKFPEGYNDTLNKIIKCLDGILKSYETVSINQIEEDNRNPIDEIPEPFLRFIKTKYLEGKFDLRLVGYFANILFLSSSSCRKYFKATYKHLFVDEFQDSDKAQYYLFMRISELGIPSWAIGDVNQAIFGFADKSSEFLLSLMDNRDFANLPMDINHRCHPSIDLYGRKFLGLQCDETNIEETRVFEVHITGDEKDIGRWFNERIEKIKERFNINNNSSICIIAKSDVKLEQFVHGIDIPFKIHGKSVLDQDESQWGGLIKKLLRLGFDNTASAYGFIEVYLDIESPKERIRVKKAKEAINQFREACQHYQRSGELQINSICQLGSEVLNLLLPDARNEFSILNLEYFLRNEEHKMSFFYPPKDEEIQLMNIHKVKGLEYDVVIHLDLYQFILPGYDWIVNQDESELQASKYLHYVGITRAKEALIIATSSLRYQSNRGRSIEGVVSEFLDGEVERYRLNWED